MQLRTEGNGNKTVVLEVADDGAGMVREPGKSAEGVGIMAMRERLQQLGGTLEINSSPRGTMVVARVSAPRVRRRSES